MTSPDEYLNQSSINHMMHVVAACSERTHKPYSLIALFGGPAVQIFVR